MKINKKIILGLTMLSLLITGFSVKADCIVPTIATNLDYGKLFKLSRATYYQTCEQASKSFQCIGTSFTGQDVASYKYGECEQPLWSQCRDVWKSDFKNHLDKIIAYKIDTATSSDICAQNRINLECIDGIWSGGSQNNLFSNCEVSTSCTLTGLDNSIINIPSGSGRYLFYTPISVYPKTCSQSSGYVSCDKGKIFGNPNFYGYPTCEEGTNKTCYFTGKDARGLDKQFIIPNLATIVFYKDYVSNYPETCRTNSTELYCRNGSIIGDYSTYKASYCYDSSAKDCPFTGVDSRGQDKSFLIRNGEKKTFYQQGDAPDGALCSSGEIACDNGSLIGSFNTYRYENCTNNCILDDDVFLNTNSLGSSLIINHYSGSNSNTGFDIFSQNVVSYPKSCDDSKARLSCDNGRIIGDYKIFTYNTCEEEGGLVDGVDLRLNISSQGGLTQENTIQVGQYSSPAVNMNIKNRGRYVASGSNIAPGFLSCDWKMDGGKSVNIYKSKTIINFTLNPGTSLKKAILFNDIFTQSLGKKTVECKLDTSKSRGAAGPDVDTTNNVWIGDFDVVTAERFDISMNRAVESIKDNLDAPEIGKGAQGINNFLITKVMNVLVPLIIILGILISILGFYKLLFSDDDKAIGEGIKYITYGVMGIIVIMSAKFITSTIYSDIFQEGILSYGSVEGWRIADTIYNNLAFPFIKLAIYLALGVLFVIMASRVITFIFGGDDDTKKKAGTIIARNSIGMLVIIAAKQVVEFIYGKQETVVKAVSNLGEIGSGILANKNLPILYQVINRAMGLASLVILVMILIQAFKLLTKPDDPDAMKGIKNTLLYIVIGIIIIGTGYIITNFLIIN